MIKKQRARNAQRSGAVFERLVMTDTIQPKYEHKVYANGFSFKCEPKDQEANVMNYLITGYPLA